ncbi:hypothetical protein GW17_00041368 [Ensete ventricosum]|nr:hypothetical protein GW17_00041368 [Ensete ventricosum]
MRTARYRVVLPKIDRRRSIEGEIDRRRSIEGEKREEEEEEKKKKEEEEKNKEVPPFTVPSSPARRRLLRVTHAPSPPSPVGAFSPARGDGTSPNVGRKIKATPQFGRGASSSFNRASG